MYLNGLNPLRECLFMVRQEGRQAGSGGVRIVVHFRPRGVVGFDEEPESE